MAPRSALPRSRNALLLALSQRSPAPAQPEPRCLRARRRRARGIGAEIASGQALEDKVWKSMIEILGQDFRQRHAKRTKEAIEARTPDQRGAVGLRTRPHHDLDRQGAGNLENEVSAAGRKIDAPRPPASRAPSRPQPPQTPADRSHRPTQVREPSKLPITAPISNCRRVHCTMTASIEIRVRDPIC